MFKILIEEEHNPNCKMVGKWFIGYDKIKHKPNFTSDENEAGVFVGDPNADNAIFGNLMALNDRFGYKGSPILIKDENNGL